jgi:hypothetical protein
MELLFGTLAAFGAPDDVLYVRIHASVPAAHVPLSPTPTIAA